VTVLVPELVDAPGSVASCEIDVGEVWEGDHLCGAPAVASVILSCPGDHPEGLPICRAHLTQARAGGMWCTLCHPTMRAYLIAEVGL
jgi:hypothetical protein